LLIIKASAKVPGGCGVGNAGRSESIQIGFVVAPMLDVIQAGSPGEQVKCDVEDVVGFVVGKVQFEDVGGMIDGITKSDCFDQLHDGGDTAAGDGVLSLGELQLGAGRTNHRRLPSSVFDGQSPAKFSIASLELIAYFSVHSKPSFACVD
jgi:hypothetical protein